MTPDPGSSIQADAFQLEKRTVFSTGWNACERLLKRAAGRRRTGCVQPPHPAAARKDSARWWTCILSPAT